MDTSLLRKIDLEYGLELEIYEISRKLAGDRWYVGFIARVEIPINYLAGHTKIILKKHHGSQDRIFSRPGKHYKKKLPKFGIYVELLPIIML